MRCVQQWRDNEEAQEQVRTSIEHAVSLMFVKGYEVPLIAMFHKEVLGELLCTRQFETPTTLTVRPASVHFICITQCCKHFNVAHCCTG